MADIEQKILAAVCSRHPNKDVRLIDDGAALLCDGRRVGLADLLRYKNAPGFDDSENKIIRIAVKMVTEIDSLVPSFETARPMLKPRIYTEEKLKELDAAQVVAREWCAGLMIVPIIDFPESTATVVVDQILRWGVSDATVFDAAQNNMEYAVTMDRETRERMDHKPPNKPEYMGTPIGSVASMILTEWFRARGIERFGGEFCAAIPSRDVLIVCAMNKMGWLHREAWRVFETMPFPITTRLFVVHRDGVVPV